MFVVDTPHLDYLTLTTFHNPAAQAIADWIAAQAKREEIKQKRMQYEGTTFICEEGTCFVGVAEQSDGRWHALIQCSGMWADSVFAFAQRYIVRKMVRCTRIDVQVTIPHFQRHNQNHMEALAYMLRSQVDRPVSYHESFSGPASSKLSTVYVGSRKSDRFVRIYEKMGLGEDVFLRFEVEYKSPRAQVVAENLGADADRPGILLYEIDRISADVLYDFRQRVDGAEAWNPIVVKPEPATAKWLRTQVAPALDRFLNDHNETETEPIRTLFTRILSD